MNVRERLLIGIAGGTLALAGHACRGSSPAYAPVAAASPAAPQEMPPPAGAAADVVDLLKSGGLRKLTSASESALAQGGSDARVHVAMAVGLYHDATTTFLHEMGAATESSFPRGLDHARGRKALTTTEAELARVDEHLAAAAKDPRFALELCLACWEVDWNRRNGFDRNDELLFQIEIDAQGEPLPEHDARRKPTFRFDAGDVLWARAMVAFQRALLDIAIAYDWHGLDGLFEGNFKTLTLPIKDPARIAQARTRILEGLAHSNGSRIAYLAEQDDDREWVPSPTQQDHPMPLPMDAGVYETWEDSIVDLRALVDGREGLSVTEIAQLGDHQWADPPQGFIDIGRLLSEPADITIPIERLTTTNINETAAVESALIDVLGKSYRRQMKPSPLLARLRRMKNDMDRGNESFERKLRYLLWVN